MIRIAVMISGEIPYVSLIQSKIVWFSSIKALPLGMNRGL
jgi:hypothetical protein